MKIVIGSMKRVWIGVVAAGFIALAGASPVSGARMEVAAGDVPGLIAALNAANADPAVDVIALAAGGRYGLTDVYGTATGQNGLPVVSSDVVVEGNNAVIARYPWSGMVNMFRFFKVGAGGSLTLNDLVLEGGYATNGGAVYNTNHLVMNNVILRANRAMSGGGAIYNYNNGWVELNRVTLQGNLTEGAAGGAIFSRLGYVGLFASTLTANQAPMGSGGALHAMRYAQTVIEGCTFADNSSRFEGGAIHNYNNAFMEVTNSTLSGNYSRSYGGAAANTALLPNGTIDNAQIVITSTTLANNRAELGGAAIYSGGDVDDTVSVRLAGALVASEVEVVSQCCGARFVADVSSLATDATCGYAMPVAYADLLLGSLVFNGGMTQTHALMPGSIAVDWPFTGIVAGLPSVDQRGSVRPQDGNGDGLLVADVGAFEHEALIAIDIEPKDAANVVKLSRDQVDVLVRRGSGGLDVMALTVDDMAGAEIVFGEGLVLPTVDLSAPNQLMHHLTGNGLMLHFFMAGSGLDPADQTACLVMRFADGRAFRGCDRVKVIP
jgi:predicted outer membrane repeat protein